MTNERDLLVVGNLAMDLISGEGKFGGSAASIAVNARRLGVSTAIMSVLGTDSFSTKYRAFLESELVDTHLVPSPLRELPVCEVVSDGNTIGCSVWHDNGCHPAMEKLELDAEKINMHKIVHLVSCPPGLSKKLAKLGLTLSYEPGPMLVVDPGYFDPQVAEVAKFIFLNEEERDVVIKSQNLNSIDQVLTDRNQALVVTLGKRGSNLFVRNGSKTEGCHVPAKFVDDSSIADHIGAGDGYKAGFLFAHIRGLDLATCAQVGSEVGALAVQQAGGIIESQKLAYARRIVCHG